VGRGDLHALIALVALAGGCVSPTSVECGEAGRLCPSGRTCHVVLGSETCVATDRLAACQGRVELEECAPGEACFEGVCTPTGCGNRYTEVGERCDDGNRDDGDGCASDCRSDETCGNTIVDPGEQCDDASPTTSRDGCARCQEERPRWDVLGDGTPLFVTGAAAAYDQGRDRTVIFGGLYGGPGPFPSSSETWELDGDRFTSRASAQRPPPRFGAAMAYDAARRRVVLFGGTTGSVDYNDTWEWDGDHWTLLAIASPPGRSDHAMAYDARRRRIVMGGGARVMTGLLDDTWELGLDTHGVLAWRPLLLAKLPQSDHALVYDPSRDRIISIGKKISELVGDIWEERADARFDEGVAAFDPRSNTIVIVDGPDLHRWDGVTISTVEGIVTRPPSRLNPVFTTDTHAQRLVLFGGAEPKIDCLGPCALGDLWLWDGMWTELGASSTERRIPPPRKEMAVAHDHERGRTYMFGGETLDETWLLEGEQWTELLPVKRPSARSGARMVATPDGSIVLFGGFTQADVYSDETWRFDGSTWSLLPTGVTPPGRKDHVMFYDATAQTIVMFGGRNDITPNDDELGDAWTFDGAWRPVVQIGAWPADRSSAIAAWDFARARGVMFSGRGATGPLGDTWLWHDGGWELASSTNAPGAGDGGALAWHAPRASLLLFGGGGGDELWEWNGTDWSFVLVDRGPTPRRSPQLVPTRDRRGVVMFSALDGPPGFDMWRFQYDAVVPYESCSTQLDLDGDGVGACADPDCAARCASCGNTVCDAGETCASCPGDCGGCATTCGDGRCDVAEPCPGDCP